MKTPASQKDIHIKESFEPLFHIPDDGRFTFMTPHIYKGLSAPYNGQSPFQLRKKVLSSLMCAAEILEKRKHGYRLKIFDAYRPLAVQEFMVNHTAKEFCLKTFHKPLQDANEAEKKESLNYAFQIFAEPDTSRQSPPPHSTGGAIDLTIINSEGVELPMGSMIDEVKWAHPDAFKDDESASWIRFHQNRILLRDTMEQTGFVQHPQEWWHFSQWDQLAVFTESLRFQVSSILSAPYGRIDP